jgi:hypothetical protein
VITTNLPEDRLLLKVGGRAMDRLQALIDGRYIELDGPSGRVKGALK